MHRIFALLVSLTIPNILLASEPIIPAPPQLAAQGYLLIDAVTGTVLVEHNSKQRLPPASLTKIMTSFVVATEIERGTISLQDSVNISVKAWRMEGSRTFIQEGTRVAVLDLLKEEGVTSIAVVCIVTCPEGLGAVDKRHPDVPIYTASVDECLNEHKYIVPGLGDAGDRLFGTK